MANNTGEEDAVDGPVRWSPITISGYDNNGKEHQRKAIWENQCIGYYRRQDMLNDTYSLWSKDRPRDLRCCYIPPESTMGSLSKVTQKNVSTSKGRLRWAWQSQDRPMRFSALRSSSKKFRSTTMANPTTKIQPDARNQPYIPSFSDSIILGQGGLAMDDEPRPSQQLQQVWNMPELMR